MRSFRALLASLGAGTCLILAGTVAMASLSTVVAFSGMPGMRLERKASTPTVLLAAAPDDAAPAQAAREAAVATLPRPTPTAAAAPEPARSTTPARPSTALATPSSSAPAGVGSALPPGTPAPARGGPAPSTPSPDPAPATPLPSTPDTTVPVPPPGTVTGPIGGLGEATEDAVTGATKGVGGAIAPVSPRAGGIVTGTGKALGPAVPSTTEAVAGLLDYLIGGR